MNAINIASHHAALETCLRLSENEATMSMQVLKESSNVFQLLLVYSVIQNVDKYLADDNRHH